MVKYILISFHCFILVQFTIAQENDNWKIDTLNLKEIYIDQLDQLYCEYDNGSLITKTKNKTREYYNDFGEISTIDISNPQKILLFYRDFQRLIILDNTLSVIQELDLETISSGMISLAIMSKRNDIWVFDEVKTALVRINNKGKLLTETEPLYYYKSGFIPNKLQMINQKVVLSNEDGIALIFDNFGQMIKEIKIPCYGKYDHSTTHNYCLTKNQLRLNRSESIFSNDYGYLADTTGARRINEVLLFTTNGRKLVYLKMNGALGVVE